ncbi:MAG: DUF2304 domain-containing protein [Armatimonadota bacterium]|nr:DUF2304 domain-containing protein [Armatimonadota bacterium]
MGPTGYISPRQQFTALCAAALLLIIVIELVRRRRLREDYAWLWLCIAGLTLLFSIQLHWLINLTHALGATIPASGAYFIGLLFLVLVNLHFSVKSSELAGRLKTLAQHSALLEAELNVRMPTQVAVEARLAAAPELKHE